MSNVSFRNPGINVSTDHVSVSSKRPQQPPAVEAESALSSQENAAYTPQREVPFIDKSEFVEVDGKKYFFNAPRGSYVNILV